MLTVPLALAGGVLGIRALDLVAFQPLDLLTMIGFIMMIGIIVNIRSCWWTARATR